MFQIIQIGQSWNRLVDAKDGGCHGVHGEMSVVCGSFPRRNCSQEAGGGVLSLESFVLDLHFSFQELLIW